MKLSVMQENLARGLSVVSRAVSSRSTLPVLANVLLRTEDAGLKLTATNLEIGITAWVPGKIEAEGALTVPARLFNDLVGGLPSGERVDLEVETGDHAAHQGRPLPDPAARHRRRGVPGHPAAGERPTTRVSQKVLRRGALGGRLRGRHRRGTAHPDRRPDPVLGRQADARRGRQLPHRGQDAATCSSPVEDTSLVVPARSYAELMRVLTDTDDPVDIMLAQLEEPGHLPRRRRPTSSAGSSTASSPTTSRSCRRRTRPARVVERDELLKAVRLSALIASSAANVVQLRVGEEGSGRHHASPPRPTSARRRARSRPRSRATR